MKRILLYFLLLIVCINVHAQLSLGTKASSKSLLRRLSGYGTIVDLWLPVNYSQTGSLVNSITGSNANILSQSTTANKPQLIQLPNGQYLIKYYDTTDDLGLSGSPFSTLTDGTLLISYKTSGNHVLFGDNTVTTRRSYASVSGSTSTPVDQNFGAPSYEVNGVSKTWANWGQVYNDVSTNSWVVVAAKSIDLSTWTTFHVGQYGSAGGQRFTGLIDCIVLFNTLLSDANIDAVSNILLNRALTKESMIPVYIESSMTVTPDAANEANTGLDFDPSRNEIIMCKWGGTTGINKLIFYDAATLTINAETSDLTSLVNSIQSGVYIESLGGYLISGQVLVDRTGTLIKNYGFYAERNNDSVYDYYNGYLYWLDAANGNLMYKATIDANSITIVETITLNKIGPTVTDSGLHVDETGYWVAEGSKVRHYSWNHILMEEFTSTGAVASGTEGITLDGNRNIYHCRDDYFHSSVANGNKIWIYTKN